MVSRFAGRVAWGAAWGVARGAGAPGGSKPVAADSRAASDRPDLLTSTRRQGVGA